MPTLSSVRLEKFDEYAKSLVDSGRFQNADAVLDAALDALRREECNEQAKQAFLVQALEDGDASDIFEGDVFESIRRELGWAQTG